MSPKHVHDFRFVRQYTYMKKGKRTVVRIYRCKCGEEYHTEDPW